MYEIFINNLFKSSLYGSALIIIIIILRKTMFREYNKAFMYYIWSVAILKLIVPITISINVSKTPYNAFYNNIQPLVHTNSNYLFYCSYGSIYFFKIMFFLWLIGLLLFGVYNVYNYFNFVKKINNLSYDICDNNIYSIYFKLLGELNIKQKISLKYCKKIGSPLGIGILKPTIFITENTYNISELEWILKHELLHFKKYDLYYKFIVTIVKIVYWFNPLIYIMCNMINFDCELACDETLLKNYDIDLRKKYAMVFINSLRANNNHKFQNTLVTGFNNNQNILKRRLENMVDLKKRKNGILASTLFIVISLILTININTFAENKKTSSSSPASTVQKQQTVTNVSDNNSQEKPKEPKVLYRGKIKDMPEKYKKRIDLNSNSNNEIIVEGRQ